MGDSIKQMDKVQTEVDELKGIMVENIDKIIERGLNLNDLKESCDNLEVQAGQFKLTSKKVKRKMFLKNKKYLLLIVLSISVLICILVIVLVALYFFVFKKQI